MERCKGQGEGMKKMNLRIPRTEKWNGMTELTQKQRQKDGI